MKKYREAECPWCGAEPGCLIMNVGHFTDYPPDVRPTDEQLANTRRLRRMMSCQECKTYTFGENDDQVLIVNDTPISTRQQPIPVPDIQLPNDGESLSDTVIRLRGEERN